jgi:outer membrane protein assembly factor BamB
MLILLATAAMLAQPLATTEVRRLHSPDAHQGVAADGRSLYAVSNHAIARLDEATGREVTRWDGDPARFKHLNSCIVRQAELVCADSNYPETPMTSRVETFDARTLSHRATRELGGDLGSLTWIDWHDGGWWACFAHYDGKGGEAGRDHRQTLLVRYDGGFREQARWHFPDAVLDRFAPRSASGGAWGDDGLLYVTGHDRPELYALRVPEGGGTLELAATFLTPTDGQAIGWDGRDPRLLWSIARDSSELVASRVPRPDR